MQNGDLEASLVLYLCHEKKKKKKKKLADGSRFE